MWLFFTYLQPRKAYEALSPKLEKIRGAGPGPRPGAPARLRV